MHGGHWEKHEEVERTTNSVNAWCTLGETRRGREERDKSSVNAKYIYIYIFFLPFSDNAQPKVAVHCNCGAKKYSFVSTIVGYILIFSDAKNSYMAIYSTIVSALK